MNKEKILEIVKNDEFRSNMWVTDNEGNRVPYLQYVEENYYPIYLNAYTDKTKIHENWFPDRNRDLVTGQYFALYPSLPIWPFEGLKINEGEPVDIELFEMTLAKSGTGASLVIFNKI